MAATAEDGAQPLAEEPNGAVKQELPDGPNSKVGWCVGKDSACVCVCVCVCARARVQHI